MAREKQHTLEHVAHLLPAGFDALSLEGIQTPAGLFGRDHRILWMNNAMGLVHRCKPRHAIGTPCHDTLKNCSTECVDCCMTEVIRTGRMVVTETSIRMPDGETRYGDLHSYPVRGDDHEIVAIFVIAFDTTRHVLGRQQETVAQDSPLSPRETEVLRLMAEGYTNTQISDVLDISAHTVKTHVTSVFNKLGVNDRTQAAVMAVRQQLI